MRQIEAQSAVAIAGDWFTAHEKGYRLGRTGNGHTALNSEDTVILRIGLSGGEPLSHGTKYTF